jgi:hypothetical protein
VDLIDSSLARLERFVAECLFRHAHIVVLASFFRMKPR